MLLYVHGKRFTEISIRSYVYLTVIGGSDKMKMYEVGTKCGHVGKKYYVEKIFAVKARDAKEAAAVARNFPRVKHDHKDAILYVEEIDAIRYEEILEINSRDAYFTCESVQEQRIMCSELNLIEEQSTFFDKMMGISIRPVFNGKDRVRNPRRYFKKSQIVK